MKTKKIVSILCLAALLVTFMIPFTAASAETYAWVKTGNGKPLNMRAEPTTNSQIVGSLKYRTKVIVHQSENGWALVEPVDWSRSNPAYVSTQFLSYTDPGPWKGKTTDEPAGPTYEDIDAAVKAIKVVEPYLAVIKTTRPTNYVHLRWFPNTSARYIAKYLCDTEIEVLAESKTWAQVRIVEDGYVGFILKSCVDPTPVNE